VDKPEISNFLYDGLEFVRFIYISRAEFIVGLDEGDLSKRTIQKIEGYL